MEDFCDTGCHRKLDRDVPKDEIKPLEAKRPGHFRSRYPACQESRLAFAPGIPVCEFEVRDVWASAEIYPARGPGMRRSLGGCRLSTTLGQRPTSRFLTASGSCHSQSRCMPLAGIGS